MALADKKMLFHLLGLINMDIFKCPSLKRDEFIHSRGRVTRLSKMRGGRELKNFRGVILQLSIDASGLRS